MRESDWSSDVCSSDLGRIHKAVFADGVRVRHPHREAGADVGRNDDRLFAGVVAGALGQRPRDLGDDAAEGALSETHSILQRMNELATQAANDTNTTADRTTNLCFYYILTISAGFL